MTRTVADVRDTLAMLAREAQDMRAREREEAAVTIRLGGVAVYCAGPGAPVVRCRTLAEWDAATR